MSDVPREAGPEIAAMKIGGDSGDFDGPTPPRPPDRGHVKKQSSGFGKKATVHYTNHPVRRAPAKQANRSPRLLRTESP